MMFYKSKYLYNIRPRLESSDIVSFLRKDILAPRSLFASILRVCVVLMDLSPMQRAVQVSPAVVRREAPNHCWWHLNGECVLKNQ